MNTHKNVVTIFIFMQQSSNFWYSDKEGRKKLQRYEVVKSNDKQMHYKIIKPSLQEQNKYT